MEDITQEDIDAILNRSKDGRKNKGEKMSPPKKLDFGCCIFKFELVSVIAKDPETKGVYYGYTDFVDLTMRVVNSPCKLNTATTFIHELNHVFCRLSGSVSGNQLHEESVVEVVGSGLVSFFRHNPVAFKWFQDLIEKGNNNE